jgi:hypothetical protein
MMPDFLAVVLLFTEDSDSLWVWKRNDLPLLGVRLEA